MEYIGRGGAESASYLLEHLENHQFALKIKFNFLAVMSREMSQKNCHVGLGSQKSKFTALEHI